MKSRTGWFATAVMCSGVIVGQLAGTAVTAQQIPMPQSVPAGDEPMSPGHLRPMLLRTQVGRLEVVSDTMGVEFGPYLHMNLRSRIRENWQAAVSQQKLPLPTERKMLVAEFTILKDGTLDGLKLAESSGDAELDHTGLDGVTHSAPFPALPDEFKGQSIRVRCALFYNPNAPLQRLGVPGYANAPDQPASPPEIGPNGEPIYTAFNNGVTLPRVTYQTNPEFSEQARREKVQGTVMLTLVVSADGVPTAIKVTRPLGKGLDEKAIEAVRQWRFKPALKDGNPVAARIAVEISFNLMK